MMSDTTNQSIGLPSSLLSIIGGDVDVGIDDVLFYVHLNKKNNIDHHFFVCGGGVCSNWCLVWIRMFVERLVCIIHYISQYYFILHVEVHVEYLSAFERSMLMQQLNAIQYIVQLT